MSGLRPLHSVLAFFYSYELPLLQPVAITSPGADHVDPEDLAGVAHPTYLLRGHASDQRMRVNVLHDHRARRDKAVFAERDAQPDRGVGDNWRKTNEGLGTIAHDRRGRCPRLCF